MHPIVVIVIFVALAVLGVFLWRQEQKRVEAVRQWALGRGWHLDRSDSRDWDKKHPGLRFFDRGHSRRGRNVITGTFEGHRVTLLDYRFVTGHGKNRQTHSLGVVLLHCEFPTIPLRIRREHVFDKVGEFLGHDDIDFESAEFSRRFHVSSSDRKWAYDVLHTRAMDYLLKAPPREIEFGFGEIAVVQKRYCDVDAYEQSLRLAADLHRMIPAYVIQQMKGVPS